MNRQENLIIYMLFMGSLMLQRIVSQHCKGDIYSDYQMMLKGHTYKTIKVRQGSLDCRQACLADTRCRSYNVLFFQQICELTNSTKEASPDDFVQNNERYHMAKSGRNPWLLLWMVREEWNNCGTYMANSVCGENVHFAGLRNLSSNKSVQK